MKAILLTGAVSLAATIFIHAEGAKTLTNDMDRVSYAIGTLTGHQWKQQGLEFDADVYARGIKDAVAGKEMLMTPEEAQQTIEAFRQKYLAEQQQKRAALAEKNKADGEAFLAANKSQPGVRVMPVTAANGQSYELQYVVVNAGAGDIPQATDKVTVNYRGTFIDGTEFDSSYKHGQPAQFQVGGVIRGWTAALLKMPVGSKWKLFIPSELAYGERGQPPSIQPDAVLIFEVELLAKEAPAAVAPAPANPPLTSDIIKVPSADEMKKGAKIEVIKTEDAAKAQASGK